MKAHRQHGFAMVSAIFLMVVLALLGGLMVTMSNSQQIGAVRDTIGTRAYYAARAGMEWGAYQAVNGSCVASSTPASLATATGFSVVVNCSAPPWTYDEGGVTTTIYQITATATTGTLGQHDHAERQLQMVVSR